MITFNDIRLLRDLVIVTGNDAKEVELESGIIIPYLHPVAVRTVLAVGPKVERLQVGMQVLRRTDRKPIEVLEDETEIWYEHQIPSGIKELTA